MSEQNHQHHSSSVGPKTKLQKDPVCGMDVTPAHAKGSSEYNSSKYYFCSLKCKSKFDQNPAQYTVQYTVQQASQHTAPIAQTESSAKSKVNVDYTCPMHPQVRQVGPGRCPICGMALEPVHISEGAEDDSEYKDLLRRLWLSTALSVPLVFMTMGGRHLIQSQSLLSQLKWFEIVFASPVVLWGGWPFF